MRCCTPGFPPFPDSAHWCPPCRGFTPKLVELYNTMKASGRDDFEFIFVSSDRDEGGFRVEGIPTLVTISPDGTIVNKSARGPAGNDPSGAEFPWPPKPLEDLADGVECNGYDIK